MKIFKNIFRKNTKKKIINDVTQQQLSWKEYKQKWLTEHNINQLLK